MTQGLRELHRFFLAHRDDEYLVLATVTGTEGSTYRKAGAMMLIASDDSHAGMISGGCLEGDLIERAREVFLDGEVRRVSYDLHDNEELILGLGLGCGGDIHLLLQRTSASEQHAPLHLLDLVAVQGLTQVLELADGQTRVSIEPAPRVLICGAGPDAVPLARQVDALGWRCTVTDHRPAFAEPSRFPEDTQVIQCRPERLAEAVELEGLDAAVVMTHHVDHDASYLKQLSAARPTYLGLLGPASRREQMEERSGIGPGVIHGPAGLDIGGELPEAIALSIMAEIHAVLIGHHGGAKE